MKRAAVKVGILLVLAAAAVWVLFFTDRPESDRLTVCFWGAFEEWDMWKRIAAAFEARYPEVPVKLEYYPGAYYTDKIRVLLASGKPPDVILFQDEPFPPFCEYGKFEDLTPYLGRPGLALDLDRDYWATAVEYFRWRGKQYGVPVWGGNNLIYVNKDIFTKLDVPLPDPDWTVEDFLATCRALTRDTDGDGRIDHYGFGPTYWLYWLPFDYAFGATYVDAGSGFPVLAAKARWAYDGPEAVRSWQFLHDLIWKHHVMPRAGEGGEIGTSVLFLTGRIGMFTSGPWEMPFLNRTDLDWDVAHVPRGPGGRGTRVTWDSLVIARDSRRKDDAWKFIHFCAGREAQEIIARTQRSVPALKAVKDLFVSARPNPGVHVERFIEAMEYARMQPVTEQWEAMARPISRIAADMMQEEDLVIEEVLRDLAKEEAPLFGGGKGKP